MTWLCLIGFSAVSAEELFDETKATTLFAFDTVSIPHTQNLRIEMRQPQRHPQNPVVRRGAPGTPDAQGVQFYPKEENGKLDEERQMKQIQGHGSIVGHDFDSPCG